AGQRRFRSCRLDFLTPKEPADAFAKSSGNPIIIGKMRCDLPFLAQGNPGDVVIEIAALAGIVIVPLTFTAWAVWAHRGRPSSSRAVVPLVAVSLLFLSWVAALIMYWQIPSAEEEIAVEMVESANGHELDRGSWSYSANTTSEHVWIIKVDGTNQSSQPIH